MTFLLRPIVLLALTFGLGASSSAQSKPPADYNVRDFDTAFSRMTRDLDDQIKRRGTVFPETIARGQKAIDDVLQRMDRNGADSAPFRKQVADYLATVNERASAAKRGQNEALVSTEVPTVTPAPGIEAIQPGPPTWCGPLLAQHDQPMTTPRDLRIPDQPSQVTRTGLHTPLKFSCVLPDFGPTQAWTTAYRQQLSNLLGFTAAENEAFLQRAAGLYVKGSAPRDSAELAARCEALPGRRDGLIEQRLFRDLERSVLGCGSASGAFDLQFTNGGIPLWLVDLPGGPDTQLARLGLAANLLNRGRQIPHAFFPATAPDPSLAIENLGLARTVSVDRAAVLRETGALTAPPTVQFDIEVMVRGDLRALDSMEAFAESAAKANPNLRAVFLDGPRAGVDAYEQQVAAATPVLDLLLAVEDRIGPEPGGIDGCAEPIYAVFSPWLKAQVQAASITEPKDVRFDDLQGALLYQALVTCGTHDGTAPTLAHLFQETFWEGINPQRGPLSAAYQGMLDAYSKAVANPAPKAGGFSTTRGQPKATVDLAKPHSNPVQPPQLGRRVGPSLHGLEKRGVIAAITPADAGLAKVSFRTESVQSPIRDCQATNRIARIDEQGRLIPVYNCRTTGWETVKVTNDPVLMPAWMAAGHKPGQLLVYRGSQPFRDERPSLGWPLAAYTSANAKTPVSILGVDVR